MLPTPCIWFTVFTGASQKDQRPLNSLREAGHDLPLCNSTVSFSVTHLLYWRGEALRMYVGPGTSNLPSLFPFHTSVQIVKSKYVYFHMKYIL